MVQQKNLGLLWVVGIFLVFLGILYVTSNASIPESPEEDVGPIRIGAILPLSGESKSYGEAIQRAYDLAVAEINSQGGIHGRELEIEYEDGACIGSRATTAAQKLINLDNVSIILGGACSSETLAAAELTQAARVLLLSPSATSPDIRDAGDLVFRTYPSDQSEALLFDTYAKETLGAKTAAILSENTDFAQAVRKAFVSIWTNDDFTIVFDESFDSVETDFRTLVTKMKASKPDVIYLVPQSTSSGERILSELRSSGVNAHLFGANSMLNRSRIAEEKNIYEGLYLSEVVLDEMREKTSRLLVAYTSSYNALPELKAFTASAYDSVYLVAEALNSGNGTGEAIAQYFNDSIHGWNGAIGEIDFDANGDVLLPLSIEQVRDGELIVAP